MPYKGGQPTLVGFLSLPFVTKITKTPLFGGPYLCLIDVFKVVSYLYTIGAVLGHARRNSLDILAKLLVVPGTEDCEASRLMRLSEKDANKRLEEFKNKIGREPDTFDEFVLFPAIEGALESEGIRLHPQDAWEAYAHGDKRVKKLFNMKVGLEMAEPRIKLFLVQGIHFGSSFPELTEKMYQKAKNHEDAEIETWGRGLIIPEELMTMSFEEGEEAVLQMVAAYTSKYHPELVNSLDLRGFLPPQET